MSDATGEANAAWDDGPGPWDEARLLAALTGIGVAHTVHRHPPLFTVEDSKALRGELPGAHVKNMFLKSKKGALWLVTCLEERRIHVRDLEKALGAQKMSFGKPELLEETLGVTPGAVTPLAAVTDQGPAEIEQPKGRVAVAVDQAILEAPLVNCHPLHNEATLALTPKDLLRVLQHAGHPPRLLDFDALEALNAAREAQKEQG
ncbi:MAG: prolyl-tRNA synthetase associated domain-containing protein [Pseudomonadota bacterium]